MIREIRELLYDIFPHSLLAKIYFRLSLKRRLDLNSPQSFNEKICWYKLYYCPNNKRIIQCADKYSMREYLESKGFAKYLVPIIGVWDNANNINWENLPNEFVLKTNHGCHFNLICKNKVDCDEKETKDILNKWLKISYGKLNVEPHYNKIHPLIICEKYIGSLTKSITDYKIHCFNGTPNYIETCSDRVENSDALSSSYDTNWNKLNYFKYDVKTIKKPICLKEMIDVAQAISKDFPYVRIDYYVVDNRPLIGELTFSPAAGMDRDLTIQADNEIGRKFDIKKFI